VGEFSGAIFYRAEFIFWRRATVANFIATQTKAQKEVIVIIIAITTTGICIDINFNRIILPVIFRIT